MTHARAQIGKNHHAGSIFCFGGANKGINQFTVYVCTYVAIDKVSKIQETAQWTEIGKTMYFGLGVPEINNKKRLFNEFLHLHETFCPNNNKIVLHNLFFFENVSLIKR